MSHFKLPVATTQEIDAILMRFWWGKNDNKGLPWVAWKKLQYTKKEGGLGFKDLPKFNDALLAKQAWRIHSKPNCLFSKLYKARYLKDKQLLEGKTCRRQSYGWASLLAGIEVLKKGCSYIVGNGKDIRVFKDNWLPVTSPRPASTTINCDLRVSDLITTSPYKHWNPVALQSYLCDEDQRLVTQIYLSQTEKEDMLIWSHTRDGNYTVSSGYNVARHAPEFLFEAPPIPYGDPILKDKYRCFFSSYIVMESSDQSFKKCNYDAAYNLLSNQVRGAWIIRNCYGHPYMWGSANLGFASSSLVAEAMALLVAMQNVWIGGYRNMIFEGDSEILVKTINAQLIDSTIQNLIEEITSLRNKLSTTTFTFVKRNGNKAAHVIVQHGPENSVFENCKVYPPKWLTPTLYSDIMFSY
ncbi:hypothetical protein Bca52824_031658 [Brassica carinata]|uniref:RNase H type-1 domain-containing protein n=1 Tax=Brassica carinata TaxID=52824 RepID=A0A8X7SB31_BRACI|nr:hypothetical protein Bca52824_031658 [Brassica carinata]